MPVDVGAHGLGNRALRAGDDNQGLALCAIYAWLAAARPVPRTGETTEKAHHDDPWRLDDAP